MTGAQDGVGKIIEELLLRLAVKIITPDIQRGYKERRSVLCLG